MSERSEDIPLLAESLLARVTPRRLSISQAAMRLLSSYDFPGNIRELRNLLERASLLCDGNELQPEHLASEASFGIDDYGGAGGFGATAGVPSGDDGVSLEELRRALVRGGTRRELARKLGLSERRSTAGWRWRSPAATRNIDDAACGALPFALALPKWQNFCQSTAAWSRQEAANSGGLR